jgi:hypothetical protein
MIKKLEEGYRFKLFVFSGAKEGDSPSSTHFTPGDGVFSLVEKVFPEVWPALSRWTLDLKQNDIGRDSDGIS